MITTNNQDKKIVNTDQDKTKECTGSDLYNISQENSFKLKRKSLLNKLMKKRFNSDSHWYTNGYGHLRSSQGWIGLKYLNSKKVLLKKDLKWELIEFDNTLKKIYKEINKNRITGDLFQYHHKNKEDITIDIETRLSNSRYLEEIEIENHDIIIIKSGQGTGKSRITVLKLQELMASGSRILVYSNRQSVNGAILEKFNTKIKEEFGDTIHIYHELNKEQLRSGMSMIMSPESNHKMRKEDDSLHDYDIIYIDEIKKLREEFAITPTLKRDRKNTLDILKHQIQWAKKIIISDADVCDDDILWIRELRHPRKSKELLIHNIAKTDTIYKKSYEDRARIDNRLKRLISEGKRIYIGTTSVKEVHKLFDHFNINHPELKILKIIGDYAEDNQNLDISKRSAIENCNRIWGMFDLVITSPCITYGTSYDQEHFDETFYYHLGTLSAEYTCQALHRIRSLKNNRINLYIKDEYQGKEISEDEVEEMLKGNFKLLESIVSDPGELSRLCSSIGTKTHRDGSRTLEKTNLLYRMYVKSEVNRINSQINIKETIHRQICKNRDSNHPINVEIKVNTEIIKKIKGIIKKEVDNEEAEIDMMWGCKDLSKKEYEKLRKKQCGKKLEQLTIEKNYLRFKYNYDKERLNRDKIRDLRKFERENQGIYNYITNKKERIKDITSIKGEKAHRERLNRLLEKVGFTGGIFSKEVVSSLSEFEEKEEVMGELMSWWRARAMMKLNRNSITTLVVIGAIIMIKIREYKYTIDQSEYVVEIIGHMLKQTENKENDRFNENVLKLLKEQEIGLEESVSYYESRCLID